MLSEFFYKQTRTNPDKVKEQLLGRRPRGARPGLRRRHALHARLQPVGSAPVPGARRRPLRGDQRGQGARSSPTRSTRSPRAASCSAPASELEADIIVTATGPRSWSRSATWTSWSTAERSTSRRPGPTRVLGYSDVPNLASTFGYINASWTLRADLICELRLSAAQPHDATPAPTSARPRLRSVRSATCRTGRGSTTSRPATCSA